MNNNRRKFLSFLPFAAALPFVRIPNEAPTREVFQYDLLQTPYVPHDIFKEIAESQQKVEATSGKSEALLKKETLEILRKLCQNTDFMAHIEKSGYQIDHAAVDRLAEDLAGK